VSVAEICVGPWPESPPKGMNYDLDMLGSGGEYDPYNVLTCICCRCGKRWSYDSPSAECRECERETLVEYLMDEARAHRQEPPLYRSPPPKPQRKVVVAPSFVESYAELSGTDEPSARAHLRERGLHLEHLEPVQEDCEAAELRLWLKNERGINYAALDGAKQMLWCDWWAKREAAA
jgi:hypothetical protein